MTAATNVVHYPCYGIFITSLRRLFDDHSNKDMILVNYLIDSSEHDSDSQDMSQTATITAILQ